MDADGEVALRDRLAGLLAGGLRTRTEPRAYDSDRIEAIVRELRALQPEDHAGRLAVAGFMPTPYRPPQDEELEQSCATCMYMERHRQFCKLPELALPVAPEWSCVLWRI